MVITSSTALDTRHWTDVQVSALADSIARAWTHDARKVRSTSEGARLHTRERAQAIRAAIVKRDFYEALDAMTSAVGRSQWQLLSRAFSLMTASGRATCLRRVWCESKTRVFPAYALPLFRKSTLLRQTVPPELSGEVPVYRGAWAPEWWLSRRRARNGLSWTTDRAIAVAFAELPLYALDRFLHGKENPPLVSMGVAGCLATATVPRAAILAYFHEEDGDGFYHEHECILAPREIADITYERVTRQGRKARLRHDQDPHR